MAVVFGGRALSTCFNKIYIYLISLFFRKGHSRGFAILRQSLSTVNKTQWRWRGYIFAYIHQEKKHATLFSVGQFSGRLYPVYPTETAIILVGPSKDIAEAYAGRGCE